MANEPGDPPRGKPRAEKVRWLLKASMELETAACWYCCGADQHGTERSERVATPATSGEAGNQNPAVEASRAPSYQLCPRYDTPSVCESQCWQAYRDRLREVVDDILARTFHDKSEVTVVDWLRGFRSPYDRPILRVEVSGGKGLSRGAETFIVKMVISDKMSLDKPATSSQPDADTLRKELKGYTLLCNPGRGVSSPIFTTLAEGCTVDGRLASLKYSDAENMLRAEETVVTLERAVLDACHAGQRSIDAVKTTIVQLYAALEHTCYRHAQFRAATDNDREYLVNRLQEGLNNWSSAKAEAARARKEVLWACREESMEFIDPVLYFNRAQWPPMPQMLIGTSHGDLHGRNVLVGVVEGETHWPVLFDYEDVKCCNPVAWDFVKMETELKKTALSDPGFLRADNDAKLIRKLYRFEMAINQQTEKCYSHNNWFPEGDDKDSPLSAMTGPSLGLAHVILAIRRMAWKCLELHRSRSRKWLHEYYFFLAAYNLYAARFQAFREVRPLKTLFLGAGMAAYRYAYGEDFGRLKEELRELDACDRIAATRDTAGIPPASLLSKATRGDETNGDHVERSDETIEPWSESTITEHRGDFAYAKVLARSRKPGCVEESLGILNRLMGQHPLVLELAYEYAFALLEWAQLSTTDVDREQRWRQTDRFLRRAAVRFRGQMHQELLARRGRLYKDQADRALGALSDQSAAEEPGDGQLPRAQKLYEKAAKAYSNATTVSEEREKYYTGINAATCWYLAGNPEAARLGARQVLDWIRVQQKERSNRESDVSLMWLLASKGEARVIAGLTDPHAGRKWSRKAARDYQSALEIARSELDLKHHSSTMIQQLERIRIILRNRRDVTDQDQEDRQANLEELESVIRAVQEPIGD